MAFLLLSTTFALSITFSAAQTITVPGLPTSLAPTATPVTAIISAVSSALPSPELGDPFSLSTYPACALSCNTDVNNTVSYDTSNIQYLCSADYRSRTSACQKVTCSSSDYDKSTLLGAEVCGALYNNDTALGSSVSSAIASATAFAANAVANKDPTKQADYPPCASACQSTAIALSGCSSLSNRACICHNAAFLEPVGKCELANCTKTENEITSYLGDQLCSSVGGANITTNSSSATNGTVASSTPVPFTGAGCVKDVPWVTFGAVSLAALVGGLVVL